MEHDNDLLKNISLILVSKPRNIGSLSGVVYKTVAGDLLAVCVNAGENGSLHFVTDEEVSRSGFSKEEVFSSAFENLQNTSYSLTDINEAIGYDDEEDHDELRILVLCGQTYENGAALLLNRNAMQEAAERLHSRQMYVIPSSRNEILLMDAKIAELCGMTLTELRDVIRFVNHEAVRSKEFLSDHPYVYDVASGELKNPFDSSNGQKLRIIL